MRLIPFLGFSGQAHDAMAFYAKALGGQVTSEMKYRDMPPSDGMPGCNEMPAQTLDHVAHSQLEIGSAILMAADGPGGGEGGSTTINVDVDSCSGVRYIRGELRDILPEDPGRRLTMAD